MKSTITRALVSAAFLSAAFALATAASAQGTADQLEHEATRLRDSVPEYARAVRLLEQAVELRSVDDARSAESLWWAAWFSYGRSDLRGARTFMEQAADRMLNQRKMLAAVTDEFDAGLIAQEEGNAAEVERLGRKTVQLAMSPSLSNAERVSILKYITYGPRRALQTVQR
jgi:hypothetical protein